MKQLLSKFLPQIMLNAVDSQPVPAAFKNYLKDRYEYYGPGLPGFDLAAELFPSASR